MDRRTFAAALGAAAARPAERRIRVAFMTHAGGPHVGSYLSALAATPEVEAVLLSDPGGRNVSEARKALGPRLLSVHESPSELLRSGSPELALVAIEAAIAPEAIHAALDAGCHVLAEKPACVRLAGFEAMVDKAARRGRHLVLALANRVDPYVREMAAIVGGGRIGKVYAVEVHIVADQTRLQQPEYHQSWLARKARAGGGHLIWLGIHWLDLAAFVTGSRIRSVAAFTANVGGQPIDTEDAAAVAMRFDNGALGTITSGYYLDRGYHSMLKVWGSHGWAELRKHPAGSLEWYSTKDPAPAVRRVDKADQPSGYTPFVRSVVRAAAGLEPPPLTAADSREALEVVFAAYRAAETGRTVAIPK